MKILFTFLYLTVIYFLFSNAIDFPKKLDVVITITDKKVHFIFYFLSTISFYLLFKSKLVPFVLLFLSVVVEILQLKVWHRSFDVKDILFNFYGITFSSILIVVSHVSVNLRKLF